MPPPPPIFNPGNIVIDKNSQFGLVYLPSGRPDWPDLNLWETSIVRGLGLIAGNGIVGVGITVLRNVARRPAGGPAVYIVPAPYRDGQALTVGIVSPGDDSNTTGTPAIFVTCSFRDAYQQHLPTGVWRNPPGVLLHELVHALMKAHGLNQMTFRWRSRAYSSPNDFLATTIQNMMLSEHDARLADGYSGDDPDIISWPLGPQNRGPFGLRADSSLTNTAAFVARNRPPLLYLWNNLPTFAQNLAGIPWTPFNPFRVLRNQLRASGRSGRINMRTRARQSAPLLRIPRRRPIRIP
jgi:hypothetical protein